LETINGLSDAGDPDLDVHEIFNGSATPGGITVGAGDGSGSFAGIIRNGAGVVSVSKIGAGTQVLSGANTYTGSTTVSGGTLQVTRDLTTPSSVNVTAGTLELASDGSHSRMIRTPGVSVSGGNIDLQDNKLITATAAGTWNGSNYTGITQLVASGRNGKLWNGPGIITGQSAALNSNYTTIGVAKASDVRPNTVSETAMWAGQTITGTDTLVMYTYGGDANLDGKLNIDDYVKIDQGIAAQLTGWANGDFNYDGKVNIDDYTTVIDSNIGNQNGIFPTAGGLSGAVNDMTAVPEPASLWTIALLTAAAGTARRRRHRS
jgi:autotransporter-associated beta strand protein